MTGRVFPRHGGSASEIARLRADNAHLRKELARLGGEHPEKARDAAEALAGAPPPNPRRTVQPPATLCDGLKAVNALRQVAAEFIVERSVKEAAKQGHRLAPARARRKRRLRDDYDLPAQHRGADRLIHEPGAVLPLIDERCAQNLMVWTLMILGRETPRATPLGLTPTVPTLSLGEALMVGTVFELARSAPKVHKAADLLLQAVGTDADLGMASDLEKLAVALRRYPEWRGRIRRCEYDRGLAEGCYRYFLAQRANRKACSPAHAVRLAEAKRPGRTQPAKGVTLKG